VPILKSEALILRAIAFRDTSKVLTVYTAEHGLVSLLAKGVRGPKPRFGAALDIFAVSDLVYYHKDSRELQLLSEAMLLAPHLGLSRDPVRYAHACAVLELLLRILTGQEPPGKLYPLAVRTLEVLEACEAEALGAVFRAFEVKAVSFLGHRPELFACVECGREPSGRIGFAPRHGGVVCGGCRVRVDGVIPLSPGGLGVLQRLLRGKLDDLAAGADALDVAGEVGRVVEAFMAAHVERYEPLRALRLARAIAPGGGGRRPGAARRGGEVSAPGPVSPSGDPAGARTGEFDTMAEGESETAPAEEGSQP